MFMFMFKLVFVPVDVAVVAVVVSLSRLLTSSNFQSAKYPGFEISVHLTSTSPESIPTTRDIRGRREGEV